MTNCVEHIRRNIAVWRLINNEGKDLNHDVKLEILRQVNKWLLSDRIQNEKIDIINIRNKIVIP